MSICGNLSSSHRDWVKCLTSRQNPQVEGKITKKKYFFILESESSWIIYHRQPFFIPHLFGHWLNCGLVAAGSACSQGSISILFLLIIGTKNVNTSLISIPQLEDVQKASDGDSHFFPVLLFARTPAIVSSKMGARISQLSSCGALLGAVVIPRERLVRN